MALEDPHLFQLIDAVAVARRRSSATGLAGALQSVQLEAATLAELAEADAAEAGVAAADKMLADYQARTLKSGREL